MGFFWPVFVIKYFLIINIFFPIILGHGGQWISPARKSSREMGEVGFAELRATTI